MEDEKTRENDLVFEVNMAEKDHATIVDRMSELLGKIIAAGTIFFLAVCFIMSFIIWTLFTDISKSNSIIMQGNSEIAALKAEEADLNAIIANQKHNNSKLNRFYSEVPALVNKPPKIINHTQVVKVPIPGPSVSPMIIVKKVPITTNISVTPPPYRNSAIYNKPPATPFPYWIYDKFNKKYHDRYNKTKGL
jgi:hypothetical protein